MDRLGACEASRVVGEARLAFIVVSHTASVENISRVKGYAGRTGRLDVVVRSLLVTSYLNSAIFYGVLERYEPPILLCYRGSCGPFSSEKEALIEVIRALKGRSPCLQACRAGLEDIVVALKSAGYRVYLLHEKGKDYSGIPGFPKPRSAFILGPHVDLPSDRLREIEALCDEKVSVGPVSLLTSHVIAFIGWLMDVRGL